MYSQRLPVRAYLANIVRNTDLYELYFSAATSLIRGNGNIVIFGAVLLLILMSFSRSKRSKSLLLSPFYEAAVNHPDKANHLSVQ